MKKTTRTARKILSVFLSVLMILTTMAVAAPGLAMAATDGNKYYVKVYVNIYDGSDGYANAYSVVSDSASEFYGKPENYSWATNDGWYGRINMTGFTVFGEGGEYDAQDVSAALLAAESDTNYVPMDEVTVDNCDEKAIATETYTFTLDSFPVEVFWINDENNWTSSNTGFAIRKLTVATSEGGTEHTLWEGLAGSDSETYNYYGSITPTGIHTCFEDGGSENIADYPFYKAITTSSQRAWVDPYESNVYGSYYLNDYAAGGVNASFSEGVVSAQSNVDFVDVGSSDAYYLNLINHSKTQTATIKAINNSSLLSGFTAGATIAPGAMVSYPISIAGLATEGEVNSFAFTYTLSDVYESDDPADTTLAEFTQPAYIGSWNESDDASEAADFAITNNFSVAMKLQATEGIISGSASVNGNSATMAYDYWVDSSGMTDWTQTGLRFYVTENSYYRLHLQPTGHADECGTMGIGGDIANTDTASFKLADLAYTSASDAYSYSGGTEATYGTTVTPTWAGVADDKNMTFYDNEAGWLRFAGNIFKGSTTSNNPGTINFNNMLWRNYSGYKNYFSGTINVYAFDKTELRSYVQQTLLDFAPMSLRYNSTAWNTYTSALLTAMDVLADQKTTQLAVNNAYAALKSAVEALQATDNLVNQIDMLTHIQYEDDIGSAEANKLASRYVLVPLGEHTVPSIASYIGNGTYQDETNKKSNLTTNYTKADTNIDILNYYYWNIDYSQVDPTIALVDDALAAFDSETFSSTFKTALTNARDNLAGLDQTTTGNNQPTSQEEVDNYIVAATDLLKHLEAGYEYCDYDANDDGVDEVTTVEATCTTDGYTSKTCTICGKEQITVTAVSAGHTWGEATKEEGNAAQHYYACSACSETKYEDHSFNYVTVTEPTYEAAGLKKGTCTACGYEITAEIPQLTDSAAPVITIAGSSNEEETVFCGGVAVAISDSRAFTLTVTKDGEEYTVDNSASFTLSEAGAYVITATDASGNVATKEITINADHFVDSWTSDGADTHSGTCTNCGETVTASHTYTNPSLARPTQNEDGTWTDGTYTYTCTCGQVKTEAAERADYTEFEEAVEALNALKENENLTADAEAELDEALAAAEALAQNLVAAEQSQIDELVKELQKVKTDVDNAISAEIGSESITEANSGIKVQFLKETGVEAVEYVQLGANGGFDTVRMRLTNGNSDLPITVTGVTADKAYIGADNTASSSAYTTATTIAVGNATDLYIVSPADFAETGIITYTINYTIDGLKGADGNAVTFETKAYLYVKGAAYNPYHFVDETCNNGEATAKWDFTISATYGDFELVHINKAPKADFGNDNLVVNVGAMANHSEYDYDDDGCYAGCTGIGDTPYVKGDAHAATYRYYIDTSLASTWQDAGLKAAFTETAASNYDDASLNVVRLANNQAYLDAISGTDKTFSVTQYASASSNAVGSSCTATTDGSLSVTHFENEKRNNEYAFGQHLAGDTVLNTSEAYFSGEIPTDTTEAKLMYSPRMRYRMGLFSYQNESVFMTTHLYITSYDKAELRQAVADAETAGYNSEYFDETKYAAYEEALKTAKEVLGKAETTQTEVDEATAALNTAIADLTAAEGEAKFILTVSHSIREGADMSGEITDTTYDYYLVSGEISPALSAEAIALEKINKYDAVAALTVTEDATHNYNYWYIDYSAVQDAIDKAEEIIADTETGYSDKYKQQVEEAKNALEEVLKGETTTTSPTSQTVVDEAIKDVTDLTGHTCDYDTNGDGKETVDDAVLTRPTEKADGTWTNATYTYTCKVCGDTKETYIARAGYTAYDAALEALNELLQDESLTDAAKAKIRDIITANTIAENLIATEQATVDAAANALKAQLDEINNDETGAYIKPDYSAYDAAVTAYEALDSVMTDADKAAVKAIIAQIEAIPEDGSKADYQIQINEAAADIAEINAKYAGCANGNHAWGEGALTRPVETDGTWADGYYTYTCEVCGDTKTETAKRADYTAYDEALAGLNTLLAGESLTDAAKTEISNIIAANTINENLIATEQDKVDAAANALKAQLDEINNDETGAYIKPDYSAYNAAVTAYEALDSVMTDADKAAVKAIIAQIEAIPEDGSKAQYQTQIDEAAAAIAAINAKYAGCANGNHIWGEAVLTTKPTAEAQGEYTETCTVCGDTKTTPVDLADYSEYKAAVDKLEDLLGTAGLTDEAKATINKALDKAEELDKQLPDDVVDGEGNVVIPGKQDIIDDLVAELEAIVTETEADIKDGSALKPDYKAWEAAETAYDALDKTNVKAEIIAEADALKAYIASKQANDTLTQKTATQDEIDEAAERLAEINAGIADGSLLKPDFADYDASHDEYEALVKQYGEKIKDSVASNVAALDAVVDPLRTDETATHGDDQSTIDNAKTQLDAIIDGINDGSLLEPDYSNVDADLATAKEKASANDVIDGVNTQITNIENAINDLQNDTSTNYKETQPIIDALEDQLEAIIEGINDGTLVKPDFEDAYTDLAKAKTDAAANDVIDSVDDAIAEIEAELKAIEEDSTATKLENQPDVDALEKELEDIIAGIADGSLVKPVYTEAEKAISNAEAIDSLTQEEQAAIEELKQQLEDIRNNPASNYKDNQDDVDALKNAAQDIVNKYAECESGNHAWGVPELTTKPAEGTQGEYTETCTVCGDTKTTPVDLADYSEYEAAVDKLEALLGTAGLTDEAKDTINEALAKAEALDKQLPADVVDGEDNVVIPGKQDIIDALVAELEAIVTETEAGIADGSLIKPDYTNVDEDLADAKEKAEDNDVLDGVDEDIKAIEDALNNLKNDPETNKAEHQDDVDALEKELEDIIAGIADGSLVKPVYTEAEKAIEDAEKDIEGGKLSDEDKAALDKIKQQLEDIKNNPASNKADDQDDVNALKDAAQDIADKYSACANGNHSYVTKTVAPTCTEKGYDVHTCSVCSKTYKDNYVDAKGHIEEVLAAVEPTCSSVGYTEGKKCLVCGTVTVAQQEISKLPHTDADNDGTCDVCGTSGLYDGCVCLCHNNHWFWHLVYLIFRLIWRVFGIHQVCACGAVHY